MVHQPSVSGAKYVDSNLKLFCTEKIEEAYLLLRFGITPSMVCVPSM